MKIFYNFKEWEYVTIKENKEPLIYIGKYIGFKDCFKMTGCHIRHIIGRPKKEFSYYHCSTFYYNSVLPFNLIEFIRLLWRNRK